MPLFPIVGPYGGIPIGDAALYIANVVLALEHVHSKDFVYRDLKPENLIIARNG
jgi:serine/threonine protein kinase